MNSQATSRLKQPELEPPNPEELEALDLRILSLLQQDSRLSFNKIARKLGISVGTAFNHIKSLEKKNVLKGYTIILDSNRVGYSLTTLIMVQVEGGHLLDVEDEVSKSINVVAVYDITGDYDAAVIAKFKDRACLNSFIKNLMAIPHVKRTVTSVVLDVVKEDLQVNLQKAGKQAESTC